MVPPIAYSRLMDDKAISFPQIDVVAILEGRKTQFRLVVKPASLNEAQRRGSRAACCPYSIGQRLWLRENWVAGTTHDPYGAAGPHVSIVYQADGETGNVPAPDETLALDWREAYSAKGSSDRGWRPAHHMPRWASRATLEIEDIRIEQLQMCTEADAVAEGAIDSNGAPYINAGRPSDPLRAFRLQWDSTHAERGYGWDTDPWVWVVDFRRVDTPTALAAA